MPASKNPKKRPRKGTFWNRASLKAAVDEWRANEPRARAKHGDIAGWDVAKVTDLRNLFEDCEAFNGDLSQWNVANVRSGKHEIEQRIVTTYVQRFARHAYETAVALRVQRAYRTAAFLRLGPSTHTSASLAALGGAELKAMLDWHPLRPAFGQLLAANA